MFLKQNAFIGKSFNNILETKMPSHRKVKTTKTLFYENFICCHYAKSTTADFMTHSSFTGVLATLPFSTFKDVLGTYIGPFALSKFYLIASKLFNVSLCFK